MADRHYVRAIVSVFKKTEKVVLHFRKVWKHG